VHWKLGITLAFWWDDQGMWIARVTLSSRTDEGDRELRYIEGHRDRLVEKTRREGGTVATLRRERSLGGRQAINSVTKVLETL